MSTNQGSHLLAAASRGMREWIHTLLPVHSLPPMGASKPMNRSWVARPNRSQWHPQTATTPCFPPWPPTQKRRNDRRATRRKDAAEKKYIKIHLLVQKHHGDRCRQTQAFSLGFHKIWKNSTFSKLVGVAKAMRLTLHFGVSQLLCHVCNGNVPRCGQIHRQLHLCRFHVMMFNFFVSIILYTFIQIGINLIFSSIRNKLLRLH